MIVTLDALFSQNKIQKSLMGEYKKFNELKKIFRVNVVGKIESNSTVRAFGESLIELQEGVDKIITKGTLVQKAIEDYIEAKRLAFPRFFFMTDA